MNKEREINDTPNDKIDPDEVRINKLEMIVEKWEEYRNRFLTTRKSDMGKILESCLSDINCLSVTEHYTTEEIKDALLGHFIYDDIIQFLLTNYMENL